MSRIILHIGPGKCGSSSIQSALIGGSDTHSKLVNAHFFPPSLFRKLDTPHPTPETIAQVYAFIENAQSAGTTKPLLLSHEIMFKLVTALVNLSKIACDLADEVIAIAYVRRQSDFMVSSFGQWFFRSPERILESANTLRDHNIDPTLFWGVERHLIAAALGGMHHARQLSGHLHFDWSQSISERIEALTPLGVSMSVGLLPHAGTNFPLIPDFLTRAGVILDADHGAESTQKMTAESIKNPSYHPSIIQAVVDTIEAGHSMPGPHAANVFFNHPNTPRIQNFNTNTALLSLLKDHIDTIFEQKNVQLAKSLNLPPEYFAPQKHVDLETICQEIQREATARGKTSIKQREQERAQRISAVHQAWIAFQNQTT